jgi:ribosomal protein S12 methylthiotransferase accessory factor
LPAESDQEANTHNDEGILHYKEGHFDIALKHFRKAGEIQLGIGEIHFNEALALDKLGDHGDAAKHFKVAQENANGNALILESKILLAHVQ